MTTGTDETPAAWLTASVVATVLGGDVASEIDTDALEEFAGAVRSYVEDRRPDLEPAAVPKHVVVAAAMLAYRCYDARTTPASELGANPDLAAMLKIGRNRGLRFGGAKPVVTVPVVVVLP